MVIVLQARKTGATSQKDSSKLQTLVKSKSPLLATASSRAPEYVNWSL